MGSFIQVTILLETIYCTYGLEEPQQKYRLGTVNNRLQGRSFRDQLPLLVYHANSADPDQTPQKAASDQGQRYLLTGISTQNTIKLKTATRNS